MSEIFKGGVKLTITLLGYSCILSKVVDSIFTKNQYLRIRTVSVIGPRDKTQTSVFDEGKLSIRVFYTGSRSQNTVGYDMIENIHIQFPSFLINSPEVKMSVTQSIFLDLGYSDRKINDFMECINIPMGFSI